MPAQTSPPVSALTRRLFPDAADLQARLALAERPPLDEAASAAQLAACGQWPAVRAVLRRVIEEGRPTLVHGDYDVDGIVATHLLFRHLRSHGVPGNCFLPSRQHHGYGLHATTVDKAVSQGYRTLIVLDCGTANTAEVAAACEQGLEVAIIDHHQAQAALPDAPLLNPHLEQTLPPYCTAGLVHEVLQALRSEGGAAAEPDEMELAAVATLADIVPLVPANWALAHHGLQALPETSNAGLAELIKVSGLHGLTCLTARQVSFSLAPRLNAAGRMRGAGLALELLQAADRESARQAARHLDQLNQERKRIADRVAREALLQASELGVTGAAVLYSGQWHVGVLGIAAAKVAEQLGLPAVVLADDPQEPGLLSGSARSAQAVNLIQALASCADVLASYGGHAEAAGVSVGRDRLEALREALPAAVAGSPAEPEPSAAALPEAGLAELTEQFETDIWRLAPFGPAFPAPRCVLSGCRVQRVGYMGRDKTHLNLVVGDGPREVRLAGFYQSHLAAQLAPGQPVRPVVEIEPDNWNNRYTIMLRLLGLKGSDGAQGDAE